MQPSAAGDGVLNAGSEIFCMLEKPVPETAGGERGFEHRREKRQRVLKRAQLIFGFAGSTIDCLIIDETRFGVLLETPLMTDVPEQVKIRFVGGTTFDALRRWATGNKIGLEFVGVHANDEAICRQKRAIKTVLQDMGITLAVQMLREAGFFEQSELQSIAEAAEIAVARLESMLS